MKVRIDYQITNCAQLKSNSFVFLLLFSQLYFHNDVLNFSIMACVITLNYTLENLSIGNYINQLFNGEKNEKMVVDETKPMPTDNKINFSRNEMLRILIMKQPTAKGERRKFINSVAHPNCISIIFYKCDQFL